MEENRKELNRPPQNTTEIISHVVQFRNLFISGGLKIEHPQPNG